MKRAAGARRPILHPDSSHPIAHTGPATSTRHAFAARLREETAELSFYLAHAVAAGRDQADVPVKLLAALTLLLGDVAEVLEERIL